MVLAANEIGLANAPDARATIGRLAVPSNSHSVVPGRVEMVLDVRPAVLRLFRPNWKSGFAR
jgi:beta-ureidopropionase / N-carbamoyl-L-amino-acid hydrolase